MTYHKVEYTLHNGKKIYALYDDHNVCKVTKECIEMLLDLYQQGIDDFVNRMLEEGIIGLVQYAKINEIAKQLKAGDKE